MRTSRSPTSRRGARRVPEFTVNGLGFDLSDLRFDDVFPAAEAPPDDAALQARYATFDGLVVDATAWQKDGKDYAASTRSLDAQQAARSIAAAQAKAKTEFETATAASAKDAQGQRRQTTPRSSRSRSATQPRIATTASPRSIRKSPTSMRVSRAGPMCCRAYKYANMDKKLDDLLKPVEDKKPVEAASNAASAKAGKAGR